MWNFSVGLITLYICSIHAEKYAADNSMKKALLSLPIIEEMTFNNYTDLQSVTENQVVHKSTNVTLQDFLLKDNNHTEDDDNEDHNGDSDNKEDGDTKISPEIYYFPDNIRNDSTLDKIPLPDQLLSPPIRKERLINDSDLQSVTGKQAVNKSTHVTTQDYLPNNNDDTFYDSVYDSANDNAYDINSDYYGDYDDDHSGDSDYDDYTIDENFRHESSLDNYIPDEAVTQRILIPSTMATYIYEHTNILPAVELLESPQENDPLLSSPMIEIAYLKSDLDSVTEKQADNNSTHDTTQDFLRDDNDHSDRDYGVNNYTKVSLENDNENIRNEDNINKTTVAYTSQYEDEEVGPSSLLVVNADESRSYNKSENHNSNAAILLSKIPLHCYVILMCLTRVF